MPRKTDSRHQLIEAARALFLERGYAATSVNDIAGRVGVTKGSFFHHFATKEELALEVLLTDFETTAEAMASGPFAGIPDPVERALGFVDHTDRIAETLWSRGSLLGTFASTLSAASPQISSLVSRAYRRLADGIAPIFDPIADRSVWNVRGMELAEEFLAVIEGGATLARAHDDPTRLHNALRGFRRYVELLVGGR
jgi:TetR/AcrR family transcriptional repressor of nem operon